MLRFYCRYPEKRASWGAVEKANWNTCQEVFRGLSDEDVNILMAVYKNGTRSLSEAVNTAAMRYGFSPSYAWKLIWDVRRAVAKGRELL